RHQSRLPLSEPASQQCSAAHPRRLAASALAQQSEGRDTRALSDNAESRAFEAQPTSGWLITLIDISDLRSAQASVIQAMQFISHDIRSPIGSIITLLEMQQTSKRIESEKNCCLHVKATPNLRCN
ncbi:hypothetical protein J4711_14000, partial [Staphylococcus epidermidis]|nr:hypothetical protein [Staphylococcus epidermidis]